MLDAVCSTLRREIMDDDRVLKLAEQLVAAMWEEPMQEVNSSLVGRARGWAMSRLPTSWGGGPFEGVDYPFYEAELERWIERAMRRLGWDESPPAAGDDGTLDLRAVAKNFPERFQQEADRPAPRARVAQDPRLEHALTSLHDAFASMRRNPMSTSPLLEAVKETIFAVTSGLPPDVPPWLAPQATVGQASPPSPEVTEHDRAEPAPAVSG